MPPIFPLPVGDVNDLNQHSGWRVVTARSWGRVGLACNECQFPFRGVSSPAASGKPTGLQNPWVSNDPCLGASLHRPLAPHLLDMA